MGNVIFLGTSVTNRGEICNPTNHTTRTMGARPSGVGNGPSISISGTQLRLVQGSDVVCLCVGNYGLAQHAPILGAKPKILKEPCLGAPARVTDT